MEVDDDSDPWPSSSNSPAAANNDEYAPRLPPKRRKTELNRARQAYVDALVASEVGEDGKVPREGWASISDDVRGVLRKLDKAYADDEERAAIFAGLAKKWSADAAADKATKRLRRVFLQDCSEASTGAISDEKLAKLLACDSRTLRKCRSAVKSTPVELTLGERAATRTKKRKDANTHKYAQAWTVTRLG